MPMRSTGAVSATATKADVNRSFRLPAGCATTSNPSCHAPGSPSQASTFRGDRLPRTARRVSAIAQAASAAASDGENAAWSRVFT